ncbi:MAG: hypothetical protein PSV13_11125 [Lacunisphaera sp.]|nr:hypothetical protein [Lacunisphaera sp.]
MNRLFPVLLPGLALFLGAVAGLHGGDWQSLLGRSPFGPAAPVPAGEAAGDLEFRGVVEEEGVWLVNLYNPVTKTAQWLPVSARAEDIEVKSYDAGAGKLEITQAGRPLSLSLKLARIALAGNTAALQLVSEPNREAADGEEFTRNLPPEARRLLQDVRRRRTLRPPFPGTEAEPPPPPPASLPPAKK